MRAPLRPYPLLAARWQGLGWIAEWLVFSADTRARSRRSSSMRVRIIRKSSAARGRARSRRSSSMRARIIGKSSAARGRVTFPPFSWVLWRRQRSIQPFSSSLLPSSRSCWASRQNSERLFSRLRSVIEDVDRPESQVRSRLAAGRKWIRTSSSCREAVNRDGRRTGCPEIGTDLLRNRRSQIHLPPAASQVQTRFRGRRWRRRARGRVMPYLAARRSSWWKSSCH